MDILFYDDIAAFQRRALPVLKSQCAVNSLKLGILAYYCQHRSAANGPLLAVGVEQDAVVAVFIQARSLYFFAQAANFTASIHQGIEEFLARRIKIPAVMGYGDTALRFAEAWKQRTQGSFRFAGKDHLYELQHIAATQPVSGNLQRAVPTDMPKLMPLFRAYYREDLGMTKTDQELEQSITEQLQNMRFIFGTTRVSKAW